MTNATESFLQDFHNARPGLTAQVFAGLPVHDGQTTWPSTYAALAGALPTDGSVRSLFDLACGDGYLLALLARRLGPGVALSGLDMSERELTAARTRLGEQALLLQGRAQDLPLAHASQDVVSCHMALMLMTDLDQVLSELRRVLRPGGQLLVLIGASQRVQGPAIALWRELLQQQPRRQDRTDVRFGDPRLADLASLRIWWQGAGFIDFTARELQQQRWLTPAQWWDWFEGMYDLHLLPVDQHAEMRQRFEAGMAALVDARGRLLQTEAFRLLQVRAG